MHNDALGAMVVPGLEDGDVDLVILIAGESGGCERRRCGDHRVARRLEHRPPPPSRPLKCARMDRYRVPTVRAPSAGLDLCAYLPSGDAEFLELPAGQEAVLGVGEFGGRTAQPSASVSRRQRNKSTHGSAGSLTPGRSGPANSAIVDTKPNPDSCAQLANR